MLLSKYNVLSIVIIDSIKYTHCIQWNVYIVYSTVLFLLEYRHYAFNTWVHSLKLVTTYYTEVKLSLELICKVFILTKGEFNIMDQFHHL